jgi:monoamine oxidase
MDRVGGRTYTINVEGAHYDMGASFIGPTQHNVINLAMEAKNELIPQYETGKKVMELNKKVSIYNSTIPNNVNFLALAQMQWVLIKINRMAKKVPVKDPHNCRHAQKWDSMTLQTWI